MSPPGSLVSILLSPPPLPDLKFVSLCRLHAGKGGEGKREGEQQWQPLLPLRPLARSSGSYFEEEMRWSPY